MKPCLWLDDTAPCIQGRPLYPGIQCQWSSGQIIAVMGKSGIGKSMLMRCIVENHNYQGRIHRHVDEFCVYQNQDQLFPWMTAKQNMEIALEDQSWIDLAQAWNLYDMCDRKPHHLSVGQRQRWLLLRAICRSESLLLCDEPLSAVDGLTKLQLARDFRSRISQSDKSVLWITHDVLEAKTVADNILVLTSQYHRIFRSDEHAETILASIQ